jgi:hypothetical protein
MAHQDRLVLGQGNRGGQEVDHSIVAEPEVGEIYKGKVVKVVDFGAFVNFFGPKDGLVHISQLAAERVAKTSDVVKEGQEGLGQAARLRRSRQGPPVDEGRRPGNRPDRLALLVERLPSASIIYSEAGARPC